MKLPIHLELPIWNIPRARMHSLRRRALASVDFDVQIFSADYFRGRVDLMIERGYLKKILWTLFVTQDWRMAIAALIPEEVLWWHPCVFIIFTEATVLMERDKRWWREKFWWQFMVKCYMGHIARTWVRGGAKHLYLPRLQSGRVGVCQFPWAWLSLHWRAPDPTPQNNPTIRLFDKVSEPPQDIAWMGQEGLDSPCCMS